MRIGLLTALVLGALYSGIFAQSLPQYPTELLLNQGQQSTMRGKDIDKKLELVQANLLESIFLKEAFGSNAMSEFSDEEDNPLGSNSHMQMYNDIMVHMLAKELAKRDLLGMKKQYKQYMRQLNTAQQQPEVLVQ
jgi:hypothetical protein